MHLPMGPRKRDISGSSTTASDGSEVLDDEIGMCGLERFAEKGLAEDDDAECDDVATFEFQLAGIEEFGTLEEEPGADGGAVAHARVSDGFSAKEVGSPPGVGRARFFRNTRNSMAAGRPRSQSMMPVLGASPLLLSALERVAAEAGLRGGSRSRLGTI